MKILIINLAGKTDRLAFQKRQMAALNLPFERIEAVEAGDISQDAYLARGFSWERPMRKTEVACLASHEKAWAQVAVGDEPALILEDDAWLADTVPALLDQLAEIKFADHVTLEFRSRKKLVGSTDTHLTGNSCLLRLYQDRTGAAAYVLWPAGAKKLLNRSRAKPGLADGVIAAAYELRSFQLEPAPAIQLDQAQALDLTAPIESGTSIGTQASQKPTAKSALGAIGFKFNRISAQLRMGLRQISVIGRAKRRYVTVETDKFRAHI